MMMMIAPLSRTRKGQKERGEVKGKYMEQFEGSRRRGIPTTGEYGAVQSATFYSMCKTIGWGMGTRGLRMVATFWAGISVEVTQEAGVISLSVESYDEKTAENVRNCYVAQK